MHHHAPEMHHLKSETLARLASPKKAPLFLPSYVDSQALVNDMLMAFN
jgi:hypothetical protein